MTSLLYVPAKFIEVFKVCVEANQCAMLIVDTCIDKGGDPQAIMEITHENAMSIFNIGFDFNTALVARYGQIKNMN